LTDDHRSITELISLAGRRVVITGGAGGIGAAVAHRAGEAGAALALIDNDENGMGRTVEGLRKAGFMTVGLPADVADTVALTAAFDRVVRELGGVDIWINNAGISPRVDTLSLTEAEWDRVLDLNLRAAFTGAKLAARHVRARGAKGVIVNIVSSTVKRATGNPVHYRVSKHGLVGLTQSLAVELGPSGIRCVAVAPHLDRNAAGRRAARGRLRRGSRQIHPAAPARPGGDGRRGRAGRPVRDQRPGRVRDRNRAGSRRRGILRLRSAISHPADRPSSGA
jgi:NAD(P)-dependent dehydrogenase (short-subunit alcohol dehydrogenase family)